MLLFACHADPAKPKEEFNITDLVLSDENGILICAGRPFTGRLYALDKVDTLFIREYTQGREDGLHKLWYPDKKIAEIRYYHEGKKTGVHTGFWENGRKKYEYRFADDLYEGTQYEWYPTGKAFSKKIYKKGYENGLQQVWTPDGKIRSNYEAKNGRNYGNIGKKNCLSKT